MSLDMKTQQKPLHTWNWCRNKDDGFAVTNAREHANLPQSHHLWLCFFLGRALLHQRKDTVTKVLFLSSSATNDLWHSLKKAKHALPLTVFHLTIFLVVLETLFKTHSALHFTSTKPSKLYYFLNYVDLCELSADFLKSCYIWFSTDLFWKLQRLLSVIMKVALRTVMSLKQILYEI